MSDPRQAAEVARKLAALDAIHRELDGTEWNSDTNEAVAGHLRDAGYTVRDLIDEEDLQE